MKGWWLQVKPAPGWEGKLPSHRHRASKRGYPQRSTAWRRAEALRVKGFGVRVMRHVPVVLRKVESPRASCVACRCKLEVGTDFYLETSADPKSYCASCLE